MICACALLGYSVTARTKAMNNDSNWWCPFILCSFMVSPFVIVLREIGLVIKVGLHVLGRCGAQHPRKNAVQSVVLCAGFMQISSLKRRMHL
jgi:ABC-type protease/lipase transport system fused ATPase/permease subunit